MSRLSLVLPTLEHIRQALAGPLPGLAGQIKMAPEPGQGQPHRWERPVDCREASVLVLLYPHTSRFHNSHSPSAEMELHLILTRRPEYPGVHGGQISLPGGRREGTESLTTTALRETQEEIGLAPEHVEILGQLTPLYTPPSNFYIYPFVGFTASRPVFKPDTKEVAELIEAPLNLLQNPAIRKEEIWHFQNYGERHIPFFDILGHPVWGATAMILSEFVTLLEG